MKRGNSVFTSKKQKYTIINIDNFINLQEKIYYLSEAEYKAKQGKGKGLKLLTIKKCIHTLPIALAQVRTGNTSLNLINEIYQIKYSLYQANEITEKVYKNTIQCRYNTKEILYL